MIGQNEVLAQDTTSNVFHFNLSKFKPIVQVFSTASYNLNSNKYGFGIGRAHLGFQYQFNQKWSTKIIIDRGRPTTAGNIVVSDTAGNQHIVENTSKEGSYYTMWLKFASLRWKATDKLTLEGGALLQNHYITQERFWGMRYVAQTFQDLYWRIPSTDLGFIAYYKINNTFSVDAAITNGEGLRINQDPFGKIKYAAGINVNPGKKLQTRIFYHNRSSGEIETGTEQLASVFVGFKPSKKFRLGGEFNYMSNLDNLKGLNSLGYSFYTAYSVITRMEIFARFDRLLFDKTEVSTEEVFNNGNAFFGGISYDPVKGVRLSFNYRAWLPDGEKVSASFVSLAMEYKL